MYIENLALNNLQWLICHKTKPNQTNHSSVTIVEKTRARVGGVFANGPGDLVSIPGRVIPKTLKMVLDTSLLNSDIRYVSRVKWRNPEKGEALPYTSV